MTHCFLFCAGLLNLYAESVILNAVVHDYNHAVLNKLTACLVGFDCFYSIPKVNTRSSVTCNFEAINVAILKVVSIQFCDSLKSAVAI